MPIYSRCQEGMRAKPEGNFKIHEDFLIHDGRGHISAYSRNKTRISDTYINFLEGRPAPAPSTEPSLRRARASARVRGGPL